MKKVCLIVGIILAIVAIVWVGATIIIEKNHTPQNPIATIQIEGYEKPIKIELDPQSAPNAVANFIKLANNGFYTDYKMSIEEKGILGDESMEMATLSNIMEYPQSDYVYGIKGDFFANGATTNYIKHEKGVITMLRDDYSYFGYTEEGYNSANCNFYLLTEDIEGYNGYYASFGKVIEGMDVLEAIAATRVEVEEDKDSKDTDKKEESNVNVITVKSISVDTFGIDYGVPEVVNYEENYEKVQKVYSQYFGNSTVVTE